jgi:hypothetical protein
VDTSPEQRQCSIIEPERDLRFSTHRCALPPADARDAAFRCSAPLDSRELVDGRVRARHALRKLLEPIREGRRAPLVYLVPPIDDNRQPRRPLTGTYS